MTFGVAVKQFSNLGKIIRFIDENGTIWDKAGEISNNLLKLLSNIPCETKIQGQNVIFELDLEKISSDSNVNIIAGKIYNQLAKKSTNTVFTVQKSLSTYATSKPDVLFERNIWFEIEKGNFECISFTTSCSVAYDPCY